jgi:hypothetical protein
MASKLGIKDDVAPSTGSPTAATPVPRRVYRLSARWAIAINWKLVSALGLALLVWALILTLLLAT